MCVCVCVCVCAHVCVCVCACVRACVRACVCVWLLFLGVKCMCCQLVGLLTICHLMDVGQFESLSKSH